jgi:uracil-DNA glycosylase family 4
MGFFELSGKARSLPTKNISLDVLHRAQCNACPLNNQKGLKHPHMAPTGSKHPVVYILGEAPGQTEDEKGKQFIGQSGQFLRRHIPEEWMEHIRWNNVVRTRPPGNKTPEFVEIECCRPSVVKDIEETKPLAIFGFGNVPLAWATKMTGVMKWNGRWVPAKIGSHICWYFPMLHPSYVMRGASDRYPSDNEFVFELDLKRALEGVQTLPDPVVHTRPMAIEGVSWVDGGGAQDLDMVLRFLDQAKKAKVTGLDYETNGRRPYRIGAKILTAAVSTKERTLAFPFEHPQAGWSRPDLATLREAFTDFLLHAEGKKAVHQLAFELEWSAKFFGDGVIRAGQWECTASQAFILDERMNMNRPDCLSLEFLCVQYFGLNIKAMAGVDRARLEQTDLAEVLLYNGVDAKYHRLLYLKQAARLKLDGLMPVYKEHLRRVPTMVLTQLKGLPVSKKVVTTLHSRYAARLKRIEAKIAGLGVVKKYERKFSMAFRPSANADVRKLILEVIGAPIDKVTEADLKPLKHPLVPLILRWRKTNKVLSTYILPVMEGSDLLFPGNMIHPVISTTRTRTWRTASEDPNIQNWPKRNEEQKEVRKQIRPRRGQRVVSFDYGQIQARNVAMESQDKALVQAFWDDYDIHDAWMEKIAEAYPGWIEGGARALRDKTFRKKKRNEAKNELVFPSLFGASSKSVATYLSIPIEVAEALHDEFWATFPDVKRWHKKLRNQYQTKGYVSGLTGFRRRAPCAPNQLINAPIQADEAAIVCDAMNRLSEQGHSCSTSAMQASMEIHDDLTFIWPAEDIEKNAEIVLEAMLNCPFKWAKIVPLVVEMSVGPDWYDLKEVGAYSSVSWKGDLRSGKVDLVSIDSWADGSGWADAEYAEGRAFNHGRRGRGHKEAAADLG